MSARYQIRVYDTNYNLTALLTGDDFISVKWTNSINQIGTHELVLWKDSKLMPLFVCDAFVEIWRSDPQYGVDWYVEYAGFHRSPQRDLPADNSRTFTSKGTSFLHLIKRRSVRYFSGSAFADKTGPSDDLMKAYVIENAGVGAVAPPRFNDGQTPNFLVDAATGEGLTFIGANALRNLFDVIRDIALFSLIDFDVVFTGTVGAPEFTFKTWFPFHGTDRTSGASMVTLAPNLDSMGLPISYLFDRSNEINNEIVFGQGSGEDREFAVQVSLAIQDSPWNQCEGSVNYRQQGDTTGLADIALANLQKHQAVETNVFKQRQSAQAVYGRDYFIGDKLNLAFDEIQIQKRLLTVDGTVQAGQEDLNHTFGDYVA